MAEDVFESILSKDDIIIADDTQNIVNYEPLVLRFLFLFVNEDSKELYLRRFIRIIEMCLHISEENIKHKFRYPKEDNVYGENCAPDLTIWINADFKQFDSYRLFKFFLNLTESTDKTVSIDIHFDFDGESCYITRNDYMKNEISMQNLYDIARILSKLHGFDFLRKNSYSYFLRVPLFNKWVEPKFNRFLTDKTIEYYYPEINFILRKQRLFNYQDVIPFITASDDLILTVFKVIPLDFQKTNYMQIPYGLEALNDEQQIYALEFKRYIKGNISRYPVKSIMTMIDYSPDKKDVKNCVHVMALGYLHCPITDEYYFVTALRNIWFKKTDKEEVILKEFIEYKENIAYVSK